ncbi:putative Pentatricopeptide repeat-containing protein [Zostera marina]|uniref:Putative Pentatricopeptide repeat-containing protein n=1 Tax=Zostera marina TaxID=29655 RepID=A0A0K9NXS0_ZOSMR|nr:putative Pentatricopeptide repeat-containing protein [Zostera marina]
MQKTVVTATTTNLHRWRQWRTLKISVYKDRKSLSQIHAKVIVNDSEEKLGNLITAYGRIGDIGTARLIFENSGQDRISIWNSIIIAYSKNRIPKEVISLYHRLVSTLGKVTRAQPDSSTFTVVLKACAWLSDLETGEEVRSRAWDCGYSRDVFVCSSVLNLYTKCGKIDDALKVFDLMPTRDLVSWSTIIAGLVNAGRSTEAIQVYRRMQTEGLEEGDGVMMVGLIQACTISGYLNLGKSIHSHILRKSLNLDVVIETSLVDMYAKNRSLNQAIHIFENMMHRTVVSWSVLISGFAQNSFPNEALAILIQMQNEPKPTPMPDSVALVSSLLACSQIGILKLGKSIHGFIIRRRIQYDRIISTALIDMYSKCGNIQKSRILFDQINIASRDLISWNAMISSYGAHGQGEEALKLFLQIEQTTNLKPDHATFASLLSALSHSGLVDEGRCWFNAMTAHYKIEPQEKHYVCVVDLLARGGHVDEAYELITRNNVEGLEIWVALLSGCRNHRQYNLGVKIAEIVLKFCPEDVGIHTLVSNVFAGAEDWGRVAEVRKVMKTSGNKKTPGFSVVEINGRTMFNGFVMDDKSHSQFHLIRQILDILDFDMKIEEGFFI